MDHRIFFTPPLWGGFLIPPIFGVQPHFADGGKVLVGSADLPGAVDDERGTLFGSLWDPPGVGGFFEPECGGDDARIITAALGFTIDELVGAGPIGAAVGLPFDVGGVGTMHDALDVWVVFLKAEDRAGNVLDDGDLAHPGVVGCRGELYSAVGEQIWAIPLGQELQGVLAKDRNQGTLQVTREHLLGVAREIGRPACGSC